MLLTLHINQSNLAAGIASFTLNQAYEFSTLTVKRIYMISDNNNYSSGTTYMKDVFLYGEFTAGVSGHTCHTNAGLNNTNTFPLGLINNSSGDGYDSGNIDYIIAKNGTLSNSLQFEIGEYINTLDMATSLNVLSFSTSETNLSSNDGCIVLILDVKLKGHNQINEI